MTTTEFAPEMPPGLFEDDDAARGFGTDDPAVDHAVLPEGFWAARAALAHVRTAARARLVSPDALLGALLARVSQYADHRFVLPAIVGRVGSLNIAIGLAGRSGAGKGSVSDESRALAATPNVDHQVSEAPAGSGEGMVRAYFTLRPDPDDKKRRRLEQRYDSVLIRVDEGETLKSLAGRQGQTTWQTIRQGFSGEALGGSYVDEARQARLGEHTYRMALLVAIQPELAQFLFDDVGGGTPQRFVWFSTADPSVPAVADLPAHPGPLAWRPPVWSDPEVRVRVRQDGDGYRRVEMRVAAPICEGIRERKRASLLGDDGDPLDSHADLLTLKVAALLAVLDGRLDVTDDDWRLALLVTGTSRRVRAEMQAAISAVGERKAWAANERAAAKADRVETAKAAAAARKARVAKVVARHVHRHGDVEGYDGCTRRCLTQSVRSNDRDLYDAALGHAVENGWVCEDGEGFTPGESKPV